MDPDTLVDELVDLVHQLRADGATASTLVDEIIDKARDLRTWLRLGGFPPWDND